MRRAVLGAATLVIVLCWATVAIADDTQTGRRNAADTPSQQRSAENTRTPAATGSHAATSAPGSSEDADPPAWRSVIAVLLGAMLLAGVAIGTGLLGRETDSGDGESGGAPPAA